MKYSYFFSAFILCCVLLVSCKCNHKYADASCTDLKTCTICGETLGDALGHIESDWQNDKNTLDVEDLTVVAYKYCTVCEEILDTKTIALDSLHDGTCFLFSPLEYTHRLGYVLETLDITQYTTEGSFESRYRCSIIDNSKNGYLATINSMSASFINERDLIIKDQNEKNVYEILNILFALQYESLFPLMSAIIITCDPSMNYESALELIESIPIYYSETVSMQNGIAYTGIGDPYYHNGIGYSVYKMTPGYYEFTITVSDE